MTWYAYVDESGTQPEQQVLTISLVLIKGRRAAERIHMRILKKLHPNLSHDLKALAKKKLHFADMLDDVQAEVASQLSEEQIAAVINCHWHSLVNEPYEIGFLRYTKMVQLLLYRALERSDGDIRVIVAQQGGWETYGKDFLTDLRRIVALYLKRNKRTFRFVDCELKPAKSVRGLQLADFYAGAVRKMFLDAINGVETSLSSPYDRIRHQVSLEDFMDLE